MKKKNEDEQNYFRIIKKGSYPRSGKQPQLDTVGHKSRHRSSRRYVMGGKEEPERMTWVDLTKVLYL